MTINLIVAVAENGIIGESTAEQYSIPWKLSADIKHFKELTTGYTIIMGRNTFEKSVRRALPDRGNIVITRQTDYQAEGCEVVHSPEEALQLAKNDSEIFIIGGGTIYQQMLPFTQRIYLTKVAAQPVGDTTFNFDESQWHEVNHEDHSADEKNDHDYSFITLERSS
jgi:dihydrofolate reductase